MRLFSSFKTSYAKYAKVFFLTLMCLVFFSASKAEAATITLPSNNLGLVGWWTLDDATGTQAYDASGNGNNGTLQNSPTWVSGRHGKALSFNGSNQYVSVPSLGYFNHLTTMTISAWVNTADLASNHTIISQLSSNGFYDFGLFYNSANGKFGAYGENPSTGADIAYGSSTVSSNTWYLVTGVLDGSFVNIYINGIFQTKTVYTSFSTGASASNAGFTIGKLNQNGSNIYFFNGPLDDLRIYNRALTAPQIAALYGTGEVQYGAKNNTNLVGAWNFDDGTGTVAQDSSGNHNDGTLTNGPTWVSGRHGGALSFNGTNQSVTSFAAATVSPAGTSRTVCMWANSVDPSRRQGLAGTRSASITNGWVFELNGTNTIRYFHTGGGSLSVSTTISPNTWYHLCTVFDISANTATIYKNGISVGSASSFGTDTGATFRGVIGGEQDTDNTTLFKGILDDVRVYNTALTQTQITALYNSGEVQRNSSQNNKLTNGLVGDWSFDGPDLSTTTAFDRSGSGNNGTLVNAPAPVAGKIGQALKFNGTNQYINAGTAASTNFSTNDFSVSLWFKTTDSNKYLIARDTGSVGWVIYQNAGGKMTMYIESGGGSQWNQLYTNDYNDGTWHHFVGVKSGNIVSAVYIDGVAQTGTFEHSGTVGNISNAGPLVIGATSAGSTNFFNGSLDDVRIYNRALSAAEVQQLYNMGK